MVKEFVVVDRKGRYWNGTRTSGRWRLKLKDATCFTSIVDWPDNYPPGWKEIMLLSKAKKWERESSARRAKGSSLFRKVKRRRRTGGRR